MDELTIPQVADHLGISRSAIDRALRIGLFEESHYRKFRKRLYFTCGIDKIREILEGGVDSGNCDAGDIDSDTAVSSPNSGIVSLAEATRLARYWRARRDELRYRVEAREFVKASELQIHLDRAFSELRAKILELPSQIRQIAPLLGVPEMQQIRELVNILLANFSESLFDTDLVGESIDTNGEDL